MTDRTGRIAQRLKELGIILPQAAAPVANYVGWVRSGNLVFTAGQLPMKEGRPACTGKAGAEVSVEEAAAAARLCAINAIAQGAAALDGDLDRIVRVVRLAGFVSCTADFTDHPLVVNGASDLMVEVFGDAGRHARSAIGCPSLPLDATVEVEAVFEVR